jgi:trichohyalin
MSDVEQILYNGREIKPFSIQRASPAIPLPTTTSSPMTSNEINTLSPTAGPEEEAEERDYTTVTSPNENTTFQENLRYETAADIEKFEREYIKQQPTKRKKSVEQLQQKRNKNQKMTTISQQDKNEQREYEERQEEEERQELLRREEEERRQENLRHEEYRERLKAKIVVRTPVGKRDGYGAPQQQQKQQKSQQKQQQKISQNQTLQKPIVKDVRKQHSSAAFGRAKTTKSEEEDLTPEEKQRQKEERIAKRKAFDERNRRQLLEIQQQKQKEKNDQQVKELKDKKRRLKLREAAKRAATEAAMAREK